MSRFTLCVLVLATLTGAPTAAQESQTARITSPGHDLVIEKGDVVGFQSETLGGSRSDESLIFGVARQKLSTKKTKVGDLVEFTLSDPYKFGEPPQTVPKGSKLIGHIEEVQRGEGGAQASLRIVADKLEWGSQTLKVQKVGVEYTARQPLAPLLPPKSPQFQPKGTEPTSTTVHTQPPTHNTSVCASGTPGCGPK